MKYAVSSRKLWQKTVQIRGGSHRAQNLSIHCPSLVPENTFNKSQDQCISRFPLCMLWVMRDKSLTGKQGKAPRPHDMDQGWQTLFSDILPFDSEGKIDE